MAEPTPQIILFTYPESVFGRRVDWYLTLRGIKYYHCRTLNRLPRSMLEKLNVHYRRIPVCAIGRDIYCDTRVIIEKCEALIRKNQLGSTNYSSPYQVGISKLLETWTIDGGPFWRTASLIPGDAVIMQDPKWLEDRAEMTGRKWTKDAMDLGRAEGLVHGRLHFDFVEQTLMADGREWVLGTEQPTLADIHAVWPFDWACLPYMLDSIPEEIISEKVYPKTFAWVKRFNAAYQDALKRNGAPEILSEEETIKRIEAADYAEEEGVVDAADPLKFEKGELVDVFPTDMASGFVHRDTGKLVSASVMDVCIQTQTKNGKDIRIHFPRVNFRVQKAAS